MKNFITIAILLVGLGFLGYTVSTKVAHLQPTVVVQSSPSPVGASPSPDHYNPEYFRNSLYANQLRCVSPVSATSVSFGLIGNVALGAGSCGQITVGTSTPA